MRVLQDQLATGSDLVVDGHTGRVHVMQWSEYVAGTMLFRTMPHASVVGRNISFRSGNWYSDQRRCITRAE